MDRKGRTPLMAACSSGQLEAAKMLVVLLGADPYMVDRKGNSALHYAARFNHGVCTHLCRVMCVSWRR